MFVLPSEGLAILEHYKYFVIFPVIVIEGPIITVISGFLVYLGFLNAILVYVVLVVGDLIGDIAHYLLGRYGGRFVWTKKLMVFLGYNEMTDKFIKDHFDKHKGKTLLISKISHGVGGIIQIAAGFAQVSLSDFIWFSLLGTIPKTLALLLLGYYLGSSYMKIDTYFNNIAFITLCTVLLLVIYFISRRFVKNYLDKN